jgi:hypothetical protein
MIRLFNNNYHNVAFMSLGIWFDVSVGTLAL